MNILNTLFTIIMYIVAGITAVIVILPSLPMILATIVAPGVISLFIQGYDNNHKGQ